MADPFGAAYKHADFSKVSASPPPAAGRLLPPSSSPPQQRRPHSAHPSNPSSPTNRSRSQSHPTAPPPATMPASSASRSPSPSASASASPAKPPKPYTRVEHPARILLSCHLLKQSSALLFHAYHDRFFVLHSEGLWWYGSEQEFEERRAPRRRMQFERSTYIMEDGSGADCKASLVCAGRTLVVKGSTDGEVQRWKEAVEHCLDAYRSNTAYHLPASKTASPVVSSVRS